MTTSRGASVKTRARVEKEESLNIIMVGEGRVLCWLFQEDRKQETKANILPVVETG